MRSNERYQGSSILFSRSKVKDLSFLLDKVEAVVAGWKGNMLSQAGRSVIVKAVAEAKLIYSMSSFYIPKQLSEKLDELRRDFWWK
ncbi:hypothetical protein IFM89_033637 [Coptis chinensis]|uniref:Uncharacterized protein n=1 Tax=Coptis chinensis TaxID=261450 RepID=A0A835LPV1_9MAGN|nr:hypothetical protein IFM89_033637 [Coptis chinensis]